MIYARQKILYCRCEEGTISGWSEKNHCSRNNHDIEHLDLIDLLCMHQVTSKATEHRAAYETQNGRTFPESSW